jgi:uncharacterized protein
LATLKLARHSLPGSAPPVQAHLAALRWLLLSKPLVALPQGATAQLAQFSADACAAIVQWIAALEQAPAPLLAWMQKHPQVRIGRYAEQLLAFYLTHGPQHRLIAAHVPLRSVLAGGKHPVTRTHGELDFLLCDAQGQHLHWELAVKFFLCTARGEVAAPTDFIGPNGVETLAHKWHKLFERQLTHTPPAPFDVHTWQPQAYTRGWMFYRWSRPVPRCDALHPDHGKAWWTDWARMAELPDAHYVQLPRLHWMAPLASLAQLGADAPVLPRGAMAVHLQNLWAQGERRSDAIMVVQWDLGAGQADRGGEVRRFFIRPPGVLRDTV